MVEWEGAETNGTQCHSLYGAVRKPTAEMLHGIRTLIVDLRDIGSRYYTFSWTMCLCLEACAEEGISVVVLDRPNPLGGVEVEGPTQEPDFLSFVGLNPLPIRHGLTLGEIATKFAPATLDLEVIACTGWPREAHHPATGLLWAPPSPNMPSYDTALVYPGACLIEGTTLSEGRGTTKPFEQFGAPYLEKEKLSKTLNDLDLPGVLFRPIEFQPVFHKHGGQICNGCFVHVTDPQLFRPVHTYVEILKACYSQFVNAGQPSSKFVSTLAGAGAWNSEMETSLEGFWKLPPYEYEFEKMPIDILWGSPDLRTQIQGSL